jgi:hypothetical protein
MRLAMKMFILAQLLVGIPIPSLGLEAREHWSSRILAAHAPTWDHANASSMCFALPSCTSEEHFLPCELETHRSPFAHADLENTGIVAAHAPTWALENASSMCYDLPPCILEGPCLHSELEVDPTPFVCKLGDTASSSSGACGGNHETVWDIEELCVCPINTSVGNRSMRNRRYGLVQLYKLNGHSFGISSQESPQKIYCTMPEWPGNPKPRDLSKTFQASALSRSHV